MRFVVRGGELNVDSDEEHEDESLESADADFEKVERQCDNDANHERNRFRKVELVADGHHHRENVFTGEYIAEKSERKGDGTSGNGDELQDADEEKDNAESGSGRTGAR